MQYFFNTNENQEFETLENQYNFLKDNYQTIFIESEKKIKNEIDKFKPTNPCVSCSKKDCKVQEKSFLAKYPQDCSYSNWQLEVLRFFERTYLPSLKKSQKDIFNKKINYNCICCGNCCRLAVSEFSYEELKERASRGDLFSKDFISVFVPYNSVEEAELANPEYFKLLNKVMSGQVVYYYYCPKLKNNKCSDYNNRPNVCKDFPHNPLKLISSTCSYNAWKKDVLEESMSLKAKMDIIEFYKEKIG